MADQSEIIRFIQAWLLVYASLAYAYAIGKIVPPGKVRALFITPVIALFLLLPLRLTSVTLCATTALFASWLATFKLALFALGKGPLATDYPIITFTRFLAIGSLPIIPSGDEAKKEGKDAEGDDHLSMKLGSRLFAAKALIYAFLYKLCMYESQLHPNVLFIVYGLIIYLSLEFITTAFRALAAALLGLQLDPQFNEPFLATSVQNLWGRRWNLAMGSILRATVYNPVRELLSPCVGKRHAQRLGVLATFATSGIMHELLFYYLSLKRPTWDSMMFFLLNGVAVVIEMDLKRWLGPRWTPPRLVSIALTFSFFIIPLTLWLMPPPFHYCNGAVRAAEELSALLEFLRSVRTGEILRSFQGRVTMTRFLQDIQSY